MKATRLRTLLIGLTAGVAYGFLTLLIENKNQNIPVSFIFILPIILGTIPVFFSTKEALESYWYYIILPWGITVTCFFLSANSSMIIAVILVAPLLFLGTLVGFIFRLIELKCKEKQTPLSATIAAKKSKTVSIVITLTTFAFVLYTEIIMEVVNSNKAPPHKSYLQLFLSYFPPFLRGIDTIMYLTLVCSIIAIIFSFAWMRMERGFIKVIVIIILILSILITLYTLLGLIF